VSGSIAVTGAHGFVGTHLLGRLGARAVAVDADVTDADLLRRAIAAARPAAVVHLAAASSVGASWTDAAEPWRINALGTVNLLEAARSNAPDARVVVVSTGDVYGQADEIPTPETAPYRPMSPYAASKAAAELAADQFRRAGSEIVIVRAFQH
jgi:GDP-4-dehydro-6-deoxy-D-mannose reductase